MFGFFHSEHERGLQSLTHPACSRPLGPQGSAEGQPQGEGLGTPSQAPPVRISRLTNGSLTLPQARRLCSPRRIQLWLAASSLKVAPTHGQSPLRSKMVADEFPSFPRDTLSHTPYVKGLSIRTALYCSLEDVGPIQFFRDAD